MENVHTYLGEILTDEWGEFYTSKEFYIPFFEQSVNINLVEYDEDFEPIEEPLSEELVNEYSNTLKEFLKNIDNIIVEIQEKAFEYYLSIYKKYYEKPFKVLSKSDKFHEVKEGELHEPLQIDTKEKHFEYMKSIIEKIIISNHQTITIPISYELDEEHGIEIKIRNNKVIKIDGIGETSYEYE